MSESSIRLIDGAREMLFRSTPARPTAVTGSTVLATNLATHGSFEKAGAPVEVRRNLATNPNAVKSVGFRANAGAVHLVALNSPAPVGHPQGITTAARSMLRVGQTSATLMSLFDVDALGTSGPGRYLGAWFFVNAGGYQANVGNSSVPPQSIPANTWVWVPWSGRLNAGAYAGAYVSKVSGDVSATDVAYVTGVTVFTDAVPTSTVAGGVVSLDPDLMASWVGPVDASESILTGVDAGIYLTPSSVGRGVLSSRWVKSGTKSLRQIPLYNTRGSGFTELASHGAPRGLEGGKTYTLVVWFYQEAPTGITTANARTATLVGTTGGSYDASVMAGDVAGEQEVRLTFTIPPTGNWYLRLYNGGMIGEPDTWWDDLTIVAGEYTGPAFTGDTAPHSPIRYEWAGEPYESEARMIRDTIEPLGEWAFSDIIGWWGQTDDKRDVSERPQAHGADPDSVALRSSRAISFNAIWLGTSQADNENAVDDLSSIGAERAVIMRVETPAGASERVVKLVHQDAADHHARSIGQVAVDAIAVDPRRYAVTPSTASTGPATPGQGRVWPAVWPLVWPGGGSSGRITLTNTATAPSAPTFILRGGFESALITCVETGSRIGINRLVPAGSSVVVDTAGARATIDGQSDVSRWLRYREWELIPARGSLTFQFDVTGATGSPTLDGSVRSAWW